MVEVPAVVGAGGVRAAVGRAAAAAIAAVLTARAQQQELTVQAALRGDRTLAVQALALDPLVPEPDVARRILDDAVRAHGHESERVRRTGGRRRDGGGMSTQEKVVEAALGGEGWSDSATAREIAQQPRVWRELAGTLVERGRRDRGLPGARCSRGRTCGSC